MDRRQALNVIAGAGIAALAGAQSTETAESNGMLYRKLGSTGERVSAIGLGGYHISVPSEQEGIRIVRSALDRGITFLDNCWDYADGVSEIRMGKALRDGYRQKAFLMTKFDGRTKTAAAQQIDQSLQRLQTDHIDLIQYHENIRLDDPDRFFAKGGSLEALMAAKQAGKIRYIGFTGHKDPLVHERMLEVAKQHNFHFDACQMPLNPMDAHFRSFANNVVPKRRPGHEADVQRNSPQKQYRDADRMPSLRAQSSNVRGHHRLRQHEDPRSGIRRGSNVQTDDGSAGDRDFRQDTCRGSARRIRAV